MVLHGFWNLSGKSCFPWAHFPNLWKPLGKSQDKNYSSIWCSKMLNRYTHVHMHVYIILTWINKYVKCMLLHRPFVLKLSIIYRFSYLLTDSPLGYAYISLAYFSNWSHGFFCSWTSYLYLNVSSIYPPLSYPSTRKPKSIIFPIGRGLSFIRFFSSFGFLVG